MTRIPAQKSVPIETRCRCQGSTRRIPLKVRAGAIFKLRRHMDELPSANIVLLTYRCSKCSSIVEITTGDLLLSEVST